MKIGKKPKHWPYAPPEQQLEALKSTVKQVSIHRFEHSLNVMVNCGFMTKSFRKTLLRRYRKIVGISYEEWRRSRRVRRT